LEDGAHMLAAFPNAQGRLLAVVRILRQGDRFLIETEEATREKLYQTLFRFTFAGDFFVEDVSERFRAFEFFGLKVGISQIGFSAGVTDSPAPAGFVLRGRLSRVYFFENDAADTFRDGLIANSTAISDEVYEVLRIENGVPKYGVDMDETTIVPELGL